MTKKQNICVIGNSHAGMMIAAANTSLVDLSVAAKPGLEYDELHIENGKITSNDSGLTKMMSRFDFEDQSAISEFDAFVIVAMNASAFSAVRLLQDHDLCLQNGENEKLRARKPRPYLSRHAYSECLIEYNKASASWKFARDLREHTDAPIFMVPQPHPSASILTEKSAYSVFQRMNQRNLGTTIISTHDDARFQSFKEIGGITVYCQPESSLQSGFLTRPEYTRNALRLDGKSEQSEEDVLHANAKLGALYWDAIEASLIKAA